MMTGNWLIRMQISIVYAHLRMPNKGKYIAMHTISAEEMTLINR